MPRVLIAALYKFVALDDYTDLRAPILEQASAGGIRGTLLLAAEGINGTIAGPEAPVRAFLAYLRSEPRLSDLVHKESWAEEMPFWRLKVRLKKEIVTIGIPGVDPTNRVGTYVKPRDWNALLADPDVVLVDTRNDYEVEIGSFRGAINPNTTSFTEFPQWTRDAPELRGKKKVAMFCTGGIRCEKASSFMLGEGVEEVFHLEGGILKYLEEVPQGESLWEGDCFVFDGRVSVNHDLQPGDFTMCFGCRKPVSAAGRQSPQYVEGVYCPSCHGTLSLEQETRFKERHTQVQLAEQRGTAHIGQALAGSDNHTDQATLASRPLPVLYSFRRCPYAIRARMALLAAGQAVELREVVLRDKPAHMLELSPKGTVPVLWLPDGTVIEESLDVMRWALSQADPQGWLPSAPDQLAAALALISRNDDELKFHLDRYKYASRYEGADAAAHREAACRFLGDLEAILLDAPFLSGARRGLTDAAILPFVRQLANVDRQWFDQAPYPSLQAWLGRELAAAPFTGVMKKHRQWHPGDAGVRFPADVA
jgi:UPF0176 protein